MLKNCKALVISAFIFGLWFGNNIVHGEEIKDAREERFIFGYLGPKSSEDMKEIRRVGINVLMSGNRNTASEWRNLGGKYTLLNFNPKKPCQDKYCKETTGFCYTDTQLQREYQKVMNGIKKANEEIRLSYADNHYIVVHHHEPRFGFLCQCDECQKNFRMYLKIKYNNKISVLNKNCKKNFKVWDDVQIPEPVDIKMNPYLWYLYSCFKEARMGDYFEKMRRMLKKHNIYFTHANYSGAIIPDIGPNMGMSLYHIFRTHDNPNASISGPDHPAQTVMLSHTDSLNSWTKRPFWKWELIWATYDTTDFQKTVWHKRMDRNLLTRALAIDLMHDIQGLILYAPQRYGGGFQHRPDLLQELHWWINFVKTHEDFFLNSKPTMPEIAVLFPWTSSVLYPSPIEEFGSARYNNSGANRAGYPEWVGPHKWNFLFGCKALIEAHYPFHVLDEREILEMDRLKDYKVLYLFGIDKLPNKIRMKIEEFHRKGGYVYGDYNSLSSSITSFDDSVLKKIFGTSLGDYYENGDKNIKARDSSLQLDGVKIYGDFYTLNPINCKVLAEYDNKPIVVKDKRSLFVGFKPGENIATICPISYIASENKLVGKSVKRRKSSLDYPEYRNIITMISREARVKKPVEILLNGKIATNIQVGVKYDGKTKVKVITFINHEDIDKIYEVKTDTRRKNFIVWDMVTNNCIEENTDGKFRLHIPSERYSIIAIGSKKEIIDMAKRQTIFLKSRFEPELAAITPEVISYVKPSAIKKVIMNKKKTLVVVGAGAKQETYISADNIIKCLKSLGIDVEKKIDKDIYDKLDSFKLETGTKIHTGGGYKILRDASVNLILIGSPRTNSLLEQFNRLSLSTETESIDMGKGLIDLDKNDGFWVVMAIGLDTEGIEKATKALKDILQSN